MKISEAAKIGNLAADMILNALRDLMDPDYTLEAALWFFGPDFGLWAEVAGIPFVEPLTIIKKNFTIMHARNLRAKILRIVNKYRFVEVLGEESGYSRKDVLRLAEKVMETLDVIAGKQKPRRHRNAIPNNVYWKQKRKEQDAQFAPNNR